LINEAQVGFVDECRRLESVTGRFLAHVPGCLAPEIGVHQRQKAIERVTLSVAPRDQQLRDPGQVGLVFRHGQNIKAFRVRSVGG
jgi:hypothetical protein